MEKNDFGLPDGFGAVIDAQRNVLDELAKSVDPVGAKVITRYNVGVNVAISSIDVYDAARHGTPRDVKIQAAGAAGSIIGGAAGGAGGTAVLGPIGGVAGGTGGSYLGEKNF